MESHNETPRRTRRKTSARSWMFTPRYSCHCVDSALFHPAHPRTATSRAWLKSCNRSWSMGIEGFAFWFTDYCDLSSGYGHYQREYRASCGYHSQLFRCADSHSVQTCLLILAPRSPSPFRVCMVILYSPAYLKIQKKFGL